jgi:hypothetical protein
MGEPRTSEEKVASVTLTQAAGAAVAVFSAAFICFQFQLRSGRNLSFFGEPSNALRKLFLRNGLALP